MNVLVKNSTGSVTSKAKLYLESGILEYSNGDISHVSFELSFNKSITIEKVEEEKKEAISSPEQSEQVQAKASKRKSK